MQHKFCLNLIIDYLALNKTVKTMSVHSKYKQQKIITLPLLKHQQSDVRLMLGKDSDDEDDIIKMVRIARDV